MEQENANTRGTWRIGHVVETGSTNADLLEAARAGAPDRTVLRADHQTAGRGRLDRRWEAPPAVNLLVSMLFRPRGRPAHEFVLAVALAARETAGVECGVALDLKWPNDLLAGGRKVAGILAQAGGTTSDGGVEHVVVGLGLNLGWSPPEATSLAEAGWSRSLTPAEFCEVMLPRIDDRLALDPADLHDEYIGSLATLGAAVRAELPDGSAIEGTAARVERDHRLVVVDDGGIEHLLEVADVVHLRPRGA